MLLVNDYYSDILIHCLNLFINKYVLHYLTIVDNTHYHNKHHTYRFSPYSLHEIFFNSTTLSIHHIGENTITLNLSYDQEH